MEQKLWIVFGVSMALLVLARMIVRTVSEKMESWITMALVLLVTLPMLWGNFHAERRGPLDDPIMNKFDLAVEMDGRVEQLVVEGLHTGEAILFVIPFWNGVNVEELQFVKEFSENLREWFPEYGVIDLTNSVKYRYFDESFGTDPYLDSINLEDFNLENWKAELDRDERSKKFLIGGDYKCTFVRMLLPRGYNEPLLYDQVVEFLEGKKRNFFSKRDDIYLADYFKVELEGGVVKEHVFPMGWCMGRGLMSDANKTDSMNYSTYGIIAVWMAFAICLISFRQAIIATSIVLLSFIWIGGTVWMLQLLGCEIYLRVYIILVYSASIVSGISFAERKFNAYNHVKKILPGISSADAWEKTKSVNEVITVTAIIAVLNFITLYQIGVVPIFEVGVLSAFSILYLWFFCLVYIPAIHIIIGGEKSEQRSGKLQVIGLWVNKQLRKVVAKCYQILDPNPESEYNYKKSAWFFVALTMLLTVSTVFVVSLDYTNLIEKDFDFIEVRTKPLEYFDKTTIYRGYKYLESIGYGFENLNILVRSKDIQFEAIYNPEFLKKVSDLQDDIRKHVVALDIFSALDGLELISQEQSGQKLPIDEQDAYESFLLMEDDMGPVLKEQLWYDDGIVMSVSILMDDSKKLELLIEHVLQLSKLEEYSNLQIDIFGKSALWPKTDQYISTGKPVNVLSSYWLVLLITAIWVAKRNLASRNSQVMRPVMTGFAMSLPFLFASSIMAIAMMILRLPLDQATACSATLAVSAAVDFGLYPISDFQKAILDGKTRREALYYALVERGEVVVVDVILNCICFIPLTQSSFLPIMRLGWVMIAMLLACGFGALIIMMSLLPCCVKEKI